MYQFIDLYGDEVDIAFNDSLSQMYLGTLEAFEVAFQDLLN